MIAHPKMHERRFEKQQRVDDEAQRYTAELAAQEQRIDKLLADHLASGSTAGLKVALTTDYPSLRDEIAQRYADAGWHVTHTTQTLMSRPTQYDVMLTFR